MKHFMAVISIPCVLFLCMVNFVEGFYGASQWASLIPGIFGNYVRKQFYRLFIKEFGRNVQIPIGTVFSCRNIKIGDNVRFGPYNSIALVDFGNDIVIAQGVHFLSGKNQHGTEMNSVPMIRQEGRFRKISIGSDVWFGAGSIVMADVANGNVVAAGAVVTVDITETNSVWGGIPAKRVGARPK